MDKFSAKVKSVKWLDDTGSVPWVQDCDAGMLALRCDGYRYGTNMVVRVAKIEVDA